MLDKPEQHTVIATARPIRVAYLVNIDDFPDKLFQAICTEAYGRWGGRRTLIVPATSGGIDERYENWLYSYDPDIVHSFVNLDPLVVEKLHERLAPSRLSYQELNNSETSPRWLRVELPIPGLSSLSVLPLFLSRTWGFGDPLKDVRLLSRYWDGSSSDFLLENFGFLSETFPNGRLSLSAPNLFGCLTLISNKSLSDPRMGKDDGATYLTTEEEILDRLGKPGGPMTLSQLSEMFAPHWVYWDREERDLTYVVVGDAASDKVLFWNVHNLFGALFFSEFTSLRISNSRSVDERFLQLLVAILRNRGKRPSNNSSLRIKLCSCSLSNDELQELAQRLRTIDKVLGITIERFTDHSAIVPKLSGREAVRFDTRGIFNLPKSQETAEFYEKRTLVPLVKPWHVKEVLPPPGFRSGNWMMDISIERFNDNSRYSNVSDVWTLPRRIRIEDAFKFEFESSDPQSFQEYHIRVVKSGLIGIAIGLAQTKLAIKTPDDLNAIRHGICNDNEWVPFERYAEKGARGRSRFAFAQMSDKGRYLTGLIQLFPDIGSLFSVLMSGYWFDALHSIFDNQASGTNDLQERLTKILRSRFKKPTGTIEIADEEDFNKIARISVELGRSARRERRFVSYGELADKWRALVEDYIKDYPSSGEADPDDYIRDRNHLDSSIQYLCECEVLFQGREWQCQNCFNRNWVGINELKHTLTCDVCGRSKPAPVSGDWQFRANQFVSEAYREHGIEPVVWALWELHKQSRSSYYFVPSLSLWYDHPNGPRTSSDLEIDAVVVVDGVVYLLEAKSSSGLSNHEIGQLVEAAKHIRPNVLLLASMEGSTKSWEGAITTLQAELPPEIIVKAIHFDASMLDRSPFLPP